MSKRHAVWNRWNAYRRATQAEMSSGGESLVWVGAELHKEAAASLLADHGGGQVQFDKDGDVVDVDDQGSLSS